MKLEYKLYFKDYLEHILYLHSNINNTKNIVYKFVILITLLFAIIGYLGDYNIFFIVVLVMGCSIIFALRYKNIIKKQNKKVITELYKWNFGKKNTLILNENDFDVFNEMGESKVYLSSLSEIIEISNYFFLKLKSGKYFIIPKSEITNTKDLKAKLNKITEKQKIEYSEKLDWKW